MGDVKKRVNAKQRRRTGKKAANGCCGHDGAACRHWRLCVLKKAEACMRYVPKRSTGGNHEHCRICDHAEECRFECFRARS